LKLKEGIQGGYVNLSQEEYQKLGQLSFDHQLSGSDITLVCTKVLVNSFLEDNLVKIWQTSSDYDKQLKLIDESHNKITYNLLEKEILNLSQNKKEAHEHSMQYALS